MKFKIYSKAGCSSCEQAKAMLDSKELDFQYLLLGKDYSVSDMISVSKTHRSFPMVTKINSDGVEEYVGALDDLKSLLTQ